ncbi:MAG: asparagine synthase (glutamine-hydrolyzing) [Verrucomicrobiae bacterium]|nr:asparagine synthase (glutamine-hydrolyzing) [Verrucomicrobiae bacterium]
MCAICGLVHWDGRPVSPAVIRAMRDVMANRGPDHAGEWVQGPVGLGHRRLKIIDLSDRANQPMGNEDGTVWLVFNGEIYNFPELTRELQAAGHRFVSHSDTEVILHGYEQWGEGVVERLDGMFALGLWDERRRQLLLARDRFGKKPLYYTQQGQRLAFASDIKALREEGELKLSLNPAAIDCYLHHLGTTQEQCIYREVHKVKPAHYGIFTSDGVRWVRYWRPPFGHKEALREKEWLERIEAALRRAVRRRLISDVPLGAFLSGGVDSSLVVALMSQVSGGAVRTFSVGFREQDYSELHYARLVAARYGTAHEEIMLQPDVLGILPALVWEFGEPFADSSAIPAFYVAQAARRSVTVALTGDGGDEMFGGYDIARAAWAAWWYERCTLGPARRVLDGVLLRRQEMEPLPLLRKLSTVAIHASRDPATRHSLSMAFGPREKATLYRETFRQLVEGEPALEVFAVWQPEIAALHPVDRHLFMTMVTRLPNDYLVKLDVTSMKVALELRSPFLDTGVAELAGAMDPLCKIRHGRQKYLLKKLAARHLPHEVIYRRKQGFALPLEHWLRREWAPWLRRWLPTGHLVSTGWFDASAIHQLIEEHTRGRANHTHRLWALLWLELWWQMFVEGTLKPGDRLKPQ